MVEQPLHAETIVALADARGQARATSLLRAGNIVAIPTETVYGLAADATNAAAVAHIYAAKGRPSFNPLIAHVSGIDMASEHVDLLPLGLQLTEAFWPGPLTLVLPRRLDSPIAALVSAGLPTLAVRCPDHPVPHALISALGRPLAAPSANASGRISATRAEHVLASLNGRIPLILDGGRCRGGIESTIVAIDGDRLRLLRAGGITREALETFGVVETKAGGIEAPGMLESHYAPSKPLRLDAEAAGPDEYMIGFGRIDGDTNLSANGDLVEAAARLFDCLHDADNRDCACIAIAPIPIHGLGGAINDRLRRAAAPR